MIKDPTLELDLKELLQKTSVYYQLLSSRDKISFEKRILSFIKLKKFKGREIEVTDTMKVMIASKAVQLTFGYKHFYFTHFKNIIIYPYRFRSKNGKIHNGEVSTKGYIAFSWENFVQGENNPRDGRSLGLHEFSHAFLIENEIRRKSKRFIRNRYLKNLHNIYLEMKSEKSKTENTFPEYGLRNFHEFFSVSVEWFFERPDKLIAIHTNLYKNLSKILNQDSIKLYQKAFQK